MADNYVVAGDVNAWCIKCKLELGHTIVTILNDLPKKVKCNTCNGQHVYRTKAPKKRATTTKDSTKITKTQEENDKIYTSKLAGFDLANAKKYLMEENFKEDEIINHPTFGTGIILTVIQDNKIEVLFEKGPKLLVQNLLPETA